MVTRAKELCLDLLDNVKKQYEQFKERGPRDRQGGGYGNSYGNRDRYNNNNNSSRESDYSYGSQYPSSAPSTGQDNAGATQDWINQYYGGQDPYAAYGGYEAYMRMYWQYYQQQQSAPGTSAGSPPGANAYAAPSGYDQLPPPPPSEAPPPPPPGTGAPPPPPSGSPPGTSGYNAVSGILRPLALLICRLSAVNKCCLPGVGSSAAWPVKRRLCWRLICPR